jgi:hypothetical protein
MERKYKVLITVESEKVKAAEEIFQKYGGRVYVKRSTTSDSPEFLMNAIRMNVPWQQTNRTRTIRLQELENEVTLVYIVNNSQMEELKRELREKQIAGYCREHPVSYSAHNLLAKLQEVPANIRTKLHILRWHLRGAFGIN